MLWSSGLSAAPFLQARILGTASIIIISGECVGAVTCNTSADTLAISHCFSLTGRIASTKPRSWAPPWVWEPASSGDFPGS